MYGALTGEPAGEPALSLLQCWEAMVIAPETFLNFSGFVQHPERGRGGGDEEAGVEEVAVIPSFSFPCYSNGVSWLPPPMVHLTLLVNEGHPPCKQHITHIGTGPTERFPSRKVTAEKQHFPCFAQLWLWRRGIGGGGGAHS